MNPGPIAAAAERDYAAGVKGAPRIVVEKIFISPDHNYFGHHGRPAGNHQTVEVGEIECVAGQGLVGDRFFNFKPDYKGQVTLFSLDVFDEVCRGLGTDGKSPGATRRNLFIRGADLNSLIGKEFEIQGVRFLGVAECTPCYWMNDAIAPGAESLLRGRGGLRAKIITSGRLRAGA
ncbi:MAG TPA: molybdenum cofactor biosysynthesis protein [Verrucomicrobiae bacterium]|nr:molybdenum cofactor biosysynthesis protein [Verrucomicrobiae bacterium]